MKEVLGIKGYMRYVDDMLLWGASQAAQFTTRKGAKHLITIGDTQCPY